MKKRIVVISDLHCGHQVGLTPTKWQYSPDLDTHRGKFGEMQRQMWGWYEKTINQLRPIWTLVVNGDAVDGRGEKTEGVEQITTDMDEQANMASACIKLANPRKIIMTYGTPYHTGSGCDWENKVAATVHAEKIGGHESIDVNGLIFDFKHFVGNSNTLTKATAIARERLWNTQWYLEGSLPLAKIIVRSHIHCDHFTGDSKWMGITTPALQGFGSRYGIRKCSGIVRIGMTYFDIDDKGNVEEWDFVTADLEDQRVEALKV